MSRVQLIEAADAPLLAREVYAGGDPGPIAKALALVPEHLMPTLGFIGSLYGPTSIAFRPKEIVILRTSAVLACQYCINAHTVVALDVGLDHAEVTALRTGGDVPSPWFTTASERALINWIDAVAGGRGAIPDSIADELARHWPEHDIVELTLCIGVTMVLNRLCTALELPTDEGTYARLTSEGFSS
jgi:AhpD family alkylhydroperoxidase